MTRTYHANNNISYVNACRFLNRNNNNDAAARAEVARYFAGVVKSVNERLEQLDAGGFSVRVILTQVLILTVSTAFR